jgi:transcriptional regulator with XRE-family HTH domain
MAQKMSHTQRGATGRPVTPQKGCWIKYQLNLRNITYKTVAAKAGVSEVMITQFVKGRKNSEKVRRALAETLGYPSFEALITASRGKGAV